MALPPQVADLIGKVVTPAFTEPVARVFVFAEWEGRPGFAAIYTGKQGQPFLRDLQPITLYVSSPRPRTEPFRITTTAGDEWLVYKGGCGCGSPIKRATTRMALDARDKLDLQSASVPQGG